MARKVRIFTPEQAREKTLAKLQKAGAKGAASPVTAKTSAADREVYERVLAQLAEEGAVVVITGGSKTRYLLREFAPSAATAADKMIALAAAKHPVLLAMPELKKALSAAERVFLVEAIQLLETEQRLVKLVRGKAFIFAHADALRTQLGLATPIASLRIQIEPQQVRRAYHQLVAHTGFPAVEIGALQRESGFTREELRAWLLAEHQDGRAVFALGDWSLADEAARAAAIELRGERHLLVRLQE